MTARDYAGAAGLIARAALHRLKAGRTIPGHRRLAMLPGEGAPLTRPVTIHWDAHHIPFIAAGTDADLAAALGIVHAHLRLGQMEMLRRIATARVAETIGPLGLGIDRMVKAFDIARAVPGILAMLPGETRDWLENFARGINHVLARAKESPPEFRLLRIKPEPWTIADLVTIGRLVSADVNWLVWMRLLRHRADPDWPELWPRLLAGDMLSVLTQEDGDAAAETWLGASLRSGSNSVAVAGARSESGAAMIANDPHLSIMLPNPFLLAGFMSPSFHAAGCMIPGVPFLAFGRNPRLAWGGASLHAASSDLVAIPDGTPLSARHERIAVRGRGDVRAAFEESPWGPVIAPGLALRWIGHAPSDEFSAMLGVMRARDGGEFRAALASYAVPGLEINYADAEGHIGQMTAARLPRRDGAPPDELAQAPQTGPMDAGWNDLMTAADLPMRENPPEGFLVSANARPDMPMPIIGFHFSPPDRKARLTGILSSKPRLGVTDLKAAQRDVHLPRALAMAHAMLSWLRESRPSPRQKPLVAVLANWDGGYDAASQGALAFELLLFHLAEALVPTRKRALYAAAWSQRGLLWADIEAAAPARRASAMVRALSAAARDFGTGKEWGRVHRLRPAHLMGAAPGLARLYRAADLPASGTSETLMKTAHALTSRRHGAAYGSVARHVSDMSDPDANFFALLGGQDGWLGSEHFADQIALWNRGAYVTLPLDPERARALAVHSIIVTP